MAGTPGEPYYGHKTIVNAPKELLWSLMLDKIRHPDKYLPVKDVQILDEGNSAELGEWVLRHMVIPPGREVKEKIRYKEDELLVVFELVDHPVLEGAIYNKVHVNDGEVSLEFWSTHKHKEGMEAPEGEAFSKQQAENMKMGVLHCKDSAEKMHAEGKTSV